MYNDFLGFILLASGCFLMSSAVQLRINGSISRITMLPRGMNESMIQNRAGFAKYMFPRALAVGIYTVFAGAFEIFLERSMTSFLPGLAVIVILMVLIIWYSRSLQNALRDYARNGK